MISTTKEINRGHERSNAGGVESCFQCGDPGGLPEEVAFVLRPQKQEGTR